MSSARAAKDWIAQCETLTSRRGHRITGQGPAVLLVHGFPAWSYDYTAVAGDLAADHTVITFDFLRYGASDRPNPFAYSVAYSVADSAKPGGHRPQ